MVNNLSLTFMVLSLILSLILPIGGIIYLKKKYNASLKVFFIGVVAFFISVQILEGVIHNYVFNINNYTSNFLISNPIFYMLYGGLMAGIFEESARFISFKYLIKERDNVSAITYGVGHGGIESILIGFIGSINTIIYAVLINKGGFLNLLEAIGISKDIIDTTYNQMINSPEITWLLPGLERIMAIIIQISLSVLVMQAIKNKKYIYYVLAIICHAIVDFPAALYQIGVLKNVYMVEGIILIITILIIVVIFNKFIKNKQQFDNSLHF